MRLHYLVKPKIRVFVKILMMEKRNSRNFTYSFWFYLLKKMQSFDFDITLWQILSGNTYETLSKLPSFCKRYDKNILVFFSVRSSSCSSLAKRECKVSQGRVETLFGWGANVNISVRQIYSGQYVPNFITIGQVCRLYIKKNTLVCFFSGSQCSYTDWLTYILVIL